MTDLDAAIRAKLEEISTASGDLCDELCGGDEGESCAHDGWDDVSSALLAVLDVHEATYPGEVEYEWRNEPAYDNAGRLIGYLPVNSGPVTPYWCQQCNDMQPCPTKRAIATGLGIEVQD